MKSHFVKNTDILTLNRVVISGKTQVLEQCYTHAALTKLPDYTPIQVLYDPLNVGAALVYDSHGKLICNAEKVTPLSLNIGA